MSGDTESNKVYSVSSEVIAVHVNDASNASLTRYTAFAVQAWDNAWLAKEDANSLLLVVKRENVNYIRLTSNSHGRYVPVT
jgi:glycerol kinase